MRRSIFSKKRPMPQASVEFEVTDAEAVQIAADELKEKGFTLLRAARAEPTGNGLIETERRRGQESRGRQLRTHGAQAGRHWARRGGRGGTRVISGP